MIIVLITTPYPQNLSLSVQVDKWILYPHLHNLDHIHTCCTLQMNFVLSPTLISTCATCNTTRIHSPEFHPWYLICSNKCSDFHSTALTASLIQWSAIFQSGWCLTVHVSSKTVTVNIKFPGVTAYISDPYHCVTMCLHHQKTWCNNYTTNLQPRLGFWSYSLQTALPGCPGASECMFMGE